MNNARGNSWFGGTRVVLATMVALATFGVVSAIAVQGQDASQPRAEATTKQNPPVIVRLSTLTPTVCVGGEITWEWELTNLTPVTVKFYEPYLDNQSTYYPVDTADEQAKRLAEGREYFISHYWPRVDPEEDRLIVLEPAVVQVIRRSYKNSEMVERPGKYVYQVWVQGVASNEATFEVYDCGTTKERVN